MISEKMSVARYRYPAILAFTVLFVLSGMMLKEGNILRFALMLVSGLIIVIWLLVSFNSINRQIAFFFHALRNNDTAIRFPVKYRDKSLSTLFDGMNRLTDHFREIKAQSEYNENFYKTLIHYSSSGLMVLDTNNKVLLINHTACRYAGIPEDSVNLNLIAIKNPEFLSAITSLKPGDDKVFKQIIGEEYRLLVFKATILIRDDKEMKLISINDIRTEMESRELESYRKLISVLTHEIMNLVTPLTSVSVSLQSLYESENGQLGLRDLNEDMLKTTQTGLKIINEHSSALKQFVETYRKISRIPRPVIRPFLLDEWIDQIRIAFSSMLEENKIRLQVNKDTRINEVSADKNLMNQVMINLINNAVDALSEINTDRFIRLELTNRSDNRLRISISNNGPAIPPETLDRIFVPFFTTKKTGSGIGLSICQEIIRLHRGSLVVFSRDGDLTTFVIEL